MTLQYVLVDRRPVPCPDMLEWAAWFEGSGESRRVAVDDVCEFHVSTVFLGLDHNWSGEGPPMLFETLVTEGEDGGGMSIYRYSTWNDAEKGHEEVVRGMGGGALSRRRTLLVLMGVCAIGAGQHWLTHEGPGAWLNFVTLLVCVGVLVLALAFPPEAVK